MRVFRLLNVIRVNAIRGVPRGSRPANRKWLRWKEAEAVWRHIQAALRRPHTLLEYLLALALLGILVALALILGVQLHLVHRLL